MSWDFSTDPDFQEQLDWMADFVRSEIWPLEAIWHELGLDGLTAAIAPLQEQVKARGLWATHLPPGARRARAWARCAWASCTRSSAPLRSRRWPSATRRPDSGNSEILAMAGTPEQKDRWLHPLLAGDLRSAFSMTEPNTPGSDPTQLRTRAVRDGEEWVIDGQKWFSSNGSIADFLIVMAVTNPDARPSQRASMFIVPVRHARRGDPARRAHDGAPVGAVRRLRRALGNRLRRRADSRRRAARRRGRGLRARPAAARPGSHPPLHALARSRAPGVRHDVRAGHLPLRARLGAGGQADGPELDRRQRRRDAGGAPDDPARGVGDGHRRARGPRARTSR